MPRYNTERFSTEGSSISEILKYAIIIAMAVAIFIGGITIFTDPSSVELSRLTVPPIFGQENPKISNEAIGVFNSVSTKSMEEAMKIEQLPSAKIKENITDQKGKPVHQVISTSGQTEYLDEKKVHMEAVANISTTPLPLQIEQADPTIDEVMGTAFSSMQVKQNKYTYEEVMEHSEVNIQALNAIKRYFE